MYKKSTYANEEGLLTYPNPFHNIIVSQTFLGRFLCLLILVALVIRTVIKYNLKIDLERYRGERYEELCFHRNIFHLTPFLCSHDASSRNFFSFGLLFNFHPRISFGGNFQSF